MAIKIVCHSSNGGRTGVSAGSVNEEPFADVSVVLLCANQSAIELFPRMLSGSGSHD